MARKALPSADELRQLLNYNETTGRLFWRHRDGKPAFNARWAGNEAFTTTERGYKQGRIFGELYYAHRIIWRMMQGEIPNDIDHINGVRSDNRWGNLREVTRSENLRNRRLSSNNKTGFHGVSKTSWGAWQSYIGDGSETSRCLGSFKTKDEAVSARQKAEIELGYHPNHGRRE